MTDGHVHDVTRLREPQVFAALMDSYGELEITTVTLAAGSVKPR